jgi:arginyl-tRNA synthetase
MNTAVQLQADAILCLNSIYNQSFTQNDFQINITKPEFEGDYTIVLFALLKKTGQKPEDVGNALGQKLVADFPEKYEGHNIIKGFLNISFCDKYWLQFLQNQYSNADFGKQASNGKKVMVEYSSPNTNKPLHLGHLRNNFLGWSVAEILKATGHQVFKTCIVNDRGVHICKSMIAWQMFGNGATPESTNTKGDHFVGEYYVKFNEAYKAEVERLIAKGTDKKIAEAEAPIMKATQQMLLDWEAGKPEVMDLWRNMNSWVYSGFDTTYKNIGSDFDKTYYESNTYLLGKKTVEQGLQSGVFEQDADSSVWIDLTSDGLDRKIVQRKDGTSVYITQDIGLAQQKYEEYGIDKSIYVIGDEQNYHMKVLKLIAEKLQLPNANNIFHLSYGMVELPTGKMKSREGTVVDADDLVKEMIDTAKQHTEALGKVDGFTAEELTSLYNTIGLGAMKFYLVRVDPKKKMIFNPEESIDFHGFTAPFVQYTYARTKNILRKLPFNNAVQADTSLAKAEKAIVVLAEQFPVVIEEAAAELDPSKIANYVFSVAKTFNSFLAEHSVLHAETESKQQLRLQLASLTTNIIKTGMQLLGISVPEKM